MRDVIASPMRDVVASLMRDDVASLMRDDVASLRGDAPAPSLASRIAALSPAAWARVRPALTPAQWRMLIDCWELTARPDQLPPPGDWSLWLMLAGRGFGKTRAGAEWIDGLARRHRQVRIALVGASQQDVRQVMIEGESGLLSLTGRGERPTYEPSLRRLIWPGGSMAICYSAAEPEALRGPQHHFAWADEVGRWAATSGDGGARGMAAWDNLMLGLRLGRRPQALATTTPRAVPLVRRLMAEPGVVTTGGSARANAGNLPPGYLRRMQTLYGASALGRQEIEGEMIADVAGALWSRAGIEAARRPTIAIDGLAFARVVIGVDPPASASGDACGIIVAAQLAAPLPCGATIAVLADATVEKATPERWAAAVAAAAARWHADRIVAEANNGGAMVASVLHAADAGLPVQLVHASHGKVRRAEPVAVHYAAGRVVHAGAFPALEDQLCGLGIGGDYQGPGRSPDRADALVWALASLLSGATGPPTMRRV